MKISKSKRQLARLLIEAGVTKFPDGANWVAQGSADLKASFYGGYKPKRGFGEDAFCGEYCGRIHDVQLSRLIPNWHQAVLSRDEFDQIVAETAKDADGWIEFDGTERPSGYFNKMIDVKLKDGRELTDSSDRFEWDTDGPSRIIAYRLHKPEQAKSTAVGDDETNLAAKEELEALTTAESPEHRAKLARIYAPTLDQLLQDWRNADEYAQRKQVEADEAAAMRDERWQAVQVRAGEIGVTVGRCEPVVDEPELVITDWRDLCIGDEVEARCHAGVLIGFITEMEPKDYDGERPFRFQPLGESTRWCTSSKFKFIRRP